MFKICTKCRIEKDISEFSKAKTGKFGVRGDCKKCVNDYYKHYYYLENKKKISIKGKKYYKDNCEKIQRYEKEYRDKNKEKIKLRKQKYSKNNKEKIAKRGKIWREKTKNKIKRNSRHRERYMTDIIYKIKHNLKRRIGLALNGKDKAVSTMFLIGCDIDYLLYYLQDKFKEGMSWDNYGKWHIDHIKPCAKFDLSKPKEQKACFHYTNLQPLWAIDNLRKSNIFK